MPSRKGKIDSAGAATENTTPSPGGSMANLADRERQRSRSRTKPKRGRPIKGERKLSTTFSLSQTTRENSSAVYELARARGISLTRGDVVAIATSALQELFARAAQVGTAPQDVSAESLEAWVLSRVGRLYPARQAQLSPEPPSEASLRTPRRRQTAQTRADSAG